MSAETAAKHDHSPLSHQHRAGAIETYSRKNVDFTYRPRGARSIYVQL